MNDRWRRNRKWAAKLVTIPNVLDVVTPVVDGLEPITVRLLSGQERQAIGFVPVTMHITNESLTWLAAAVDLQFKNGGFTSSRTEVRQKNKHDGGSTSKGTSSKTRRKHQPESEGDVENDGDDGADLHDGDDGADLHEESSVDDAAAESATDAEDEIGNNDAENNAENNAIDEEGEPEDDDDDHRDDKNDQEADHCVSLSLSLSLAVVSWWRVVLQWGGHGGVVERCRMSHSSSM